MANENEEKDQNRPKYGSNFEVAPGEGKYEKLKLSIYKFCKITGPFDGESKTAEVDTNWVSIVDIS